MILKFELFPLHSQLLRISLLVSFPPVSDMLKFTGFSYLFEIAGLKSNILKVVRGSTVVIRKVCGGSTVG